MARSTRGAKNKNKATSVREDILQGLYDGFSTLDFDRDCNLHYLESSDIVEEHVKSTYVAKSTKAFYVFSILPNEGQKV